MGNDVGYEWLKRLHDSAIRAGSSDVPVLIEEYNEVLERLQADYPENRTIQDEEPIQVQPSVEAGGDDAERAERVRKRIEIRTGRLIESIAADDDAPGPDAPRNPPATEDLIKAYEQFSEESRYRDRIMHQSYYLILIGFILLAGNLLSVDIHGPMVQSYDVGLFLVVGSTVAISIAVIMKIYDRKCTNAEEQRAILEQVLDERYTRTGLYRRTSDVSETVGGSERTGLDNRAQDNPFAIQHTVMWETARPLEETFINKASVIATVFVYCGTVVLLLGALVLVNAQFELFVV